MFTASLLLVVVLGAVWAGLSVATPHKDYMYQPGPVAFVHRASATDCAKCHETWKSTPDTKCRACHSSRAHNPQAAVRLGLSARAPQCAQCHLEHRSGIKAPPPPDARCVACHKNLNQVKTSPTSVEKTITNFNADHPEFAIFRSKEGAKDPAHLNFGHAFHMDKAVREKKIGTMNAQWPALVAKFHEDNGIEKEEPPRTELSCTDCHVLDQSSRFFEPVKYEAGCMSCHGLSYDLSGPNGQGKPDKLPHSDPEEIHRYLQARFSELREAADSTASGGVKKMTPEQMKVALEWVRNKVDSVEQGMITGGTCAKCHEVDVLQPKPGGPPPTKLFEIVPTDITRQWLVRAWFSHTTHREMKCEYCHDTVRGSMKTEDVNLPKIAVCKVCHVQQGGARGDCAECHLYHNKKDRLRHEGAMRLPGSH